MRHAGSLGEFRGGLIFKAHGLCVSLNSRLESNEEEEKVTLRGPAAPGCWPVGTTSPKSQIKSSILRSLGCTAGSWIPASSGTNQANRKRRFDPTPLAGGHLAAGQLGAGVDKRPFEGLIREGPRFGPLSLAPVSSKELKERAFQGGL